MVSLLIDKRFLAKWGTTKTSSKGRLVIEEVPICDIGSVLPFAIVNELVQLYVASVLRPSREVVICVDAPESTYQSREFVVTLH